MKYKSGIAFALVCVPLQVMASSQIGIADASITEGNSGTKSLPFSISRSGDLQCRVIFDRFTQDQSAVAPSDYVSLPRALQEIPANSSSGSLAILINGDTAPEADETFWVHLLDPVCVGPDTTYAYPGTYSLGLGSSTGYGHNPYAVAAVDLNGDGRVDAVTANSGSNDMSVLLNTTAIGASSTSFTSVTNFSLGGQSFEVIAGDINGDGRPDLVVPYTDAAFQRHLSVFLNTTPLGGSTPTFSITTIDTPAQTGIGGVLADFNGDGRLDLALASIDAMVVYINTTAMGASSASFGPPVQLDMSTGQYNNEFFEVAAGDLNGDGKPDLVGANFFEHRVDAMINTTAPGATVASFGAVTSAPVDASLPQAVALADINGDGRLDLVSLNTYDSNDPNTLPQNVSVHIGTTLPGASAASFAAAVHYPTPNPFGAQVILRDVNGDGRPDITAIAGSTHIVMINATPAGASAPRFLDLTGLTYAAGSFYDAAYADFNGDGRLDLLLPNSRKSDSAIDDPAYDSAWVVLSTTPTARDVPTFAAAGGAGGFNSPQAMLLDDFDGDGRADLAVAESSGLALTRGATAPGAMVTSFGPGQHFSAGSAPMAIQSADLNGDGRRDLVSANRDSNNVSVLLNTSPVGSTTFAFGTPLNIAVGNGPSALALADLDLDGRLDAIVANTLSNSVSWLHNTTAPGASTSSFDAAASIAVGQGPSAVATGDLNGDGKPDLMVANRTAGTVSVAVNTTTPGGAISFASAIALATGDGPSAVAIADLNGDGRPDICVANGAENSVSVLFNTTAPGATTPTFSAGTKFATGAGPTSLVLRDLDNDGRVDLLVSNHTGASVSVFLNATAPGAAAPAFNLINTVPVADADAVQAIDLNGDSQVDLVALSGNSGSASAFLNTLFGVELTRGDAIGTIVDDDGDHVPDAFHFTAQTNVVPGTIVVSNAVMISGINVPVSVQVAGGEYSINNGPFTGTAGTITNGQSVRVRHIAASLPGTVTSTTLSVGSVSDTFTSTTGSTTSGSGGGSGGGSGSGGGDNSPASGGGAWSLLDAVALLILALRRRRGLAGKALLNRRFGRQIPQ